MGSAGKGQYLDIVIPAIAVKDYSSNSRGDKCEDAQEVDGSASAHPGVNSGAVVQMLAEHAASLSFNS